MNLLGGELEKQGVGTFADIKNRRGEALLPVPYWEWMDKHTEIAEILSKHRALNAIKFVWPLLKDSIQEYQAGDYDGAVARIQRLLDEYIKSDPQDRGWYLQEMGRYTFPKTKDKANELQIAAHKTNRYLLRPKHGMTVQLVELVAQKRAENILRWIQQFPSFAELQLALDEILGDLQFGVLADDFENAVDQLASALGFTGQRPDKEWKEGPDNLWAVRDNEHILIECKSEVDLKRSEIGKAESGQMNNAIAWFRKHYGGVKVKNVMIIPTRTVGHAAGFNEPVEIIRNANLKKLSLNVEKFFLEFKQYDLASVSEKKVNDLLGIHHLSIDNILQEYSEESKNLLSDL